MSSQKEKIEELQLKKKKRHRKLAAAIGLIVAGAVVTIGLIQVPILENINSDSDKQIEYDKEVTISSGIRPYRTSINESGVIRFKNSRSSPVNITFETNSIDRSISIQTNSSGYFNASKYENLPYRNYFNLDSVDTGEIVIN